MLKYQKEIDEMGLAECPPSECIQSFLLACRFIFNDLSHPNNFKPVGLIHPQRLNDFKEDVKKCQSLGLSMFADLEKARMHFEHLQLKTAGKFSKTVGSCVAILNLVETDGVFSDPNERSDSHFTFHEFEIAELTNRIINIEYL